MVSGFRVDIRRDDCGWVANVLCFTLGVVSGACVAYTVMRFRQMRKNK